MHPLLAHATAAASPIWLATKETLPGVLASLPEAARAFAEACRFDAAPGAHIVLPGVEGGLGAILGVDASSKPGRDPFLPAKLATVLPERAPGASRACCRMRGWRRSAGCSAAYRFTRYKSSEVKPARLAVPEGVDAAEVSRIGEAVALGRDLIATPANDLGPEELEAAARHLAERHGATIAVTIVGEPLERGFPMIQPSDGRRPVRRASSTSAGAIPAHPKVTLVGKGVVFDTGGLNIKPDAAMLLMKKDMGGAASALALAAMIMGAGLKVRLRLLLPIVENAISGAAFRPGDVLCLAQGPDGRDRQYGCRGAAHPRRRARARGRGRRPTSSSTWRR